MSELERFCSAMDGEWVAERYELEGDKLRVQYRSRKYPDIMWSHIPIHGLDHVPKIGAVGRIGFISNETTP